MKTVILSNDDVVALLPMQECIQVMEDALIRLTRGEADQPLRSLVRSSNPSGFLGLMPAYLGGERPLWGLKEVCVYPDNPSRGLDSHLGAVLLHDGSTGELIAIAEASAVTSIRTAAVTAVATRLLARNDAARLAIIGTGVQARAHLESISMVRDLQHVSVAGRTAETSRAWAEEMRDQVACPIRPAGSVQEAIMDADVVVTATSSRDPVLRRDSIPAGCHINLVGSSTRNAREADGATIAAGRLYVDRRESTVNESGDYLFALEEGAIDEHHIVAELGDVLVDPSLGRQTDDEITIFKSLGLAIEDLAATAYLYEKAKTSGRGVWIDF